MAEIINVDILFNNETVKILILVISISLILLILLISNRHLEKSISKIQEDLSEIKKHTEVQGTYLSQFNDHFSLVDNKLKNIIEITSLTGRDISSMAEGITGEVGVGKAIELARQGATSEEILKNSNLRKDQAELIVKFHGTGD